MSYIIFRVLESSGVFTHFRACAPKYVSFYFRSRFPEELKKIEYDHIPHEVKEEFIENSHHFLHSHHTCDMLYEHEHLVEVDSSSPCNQPNTFSIWKDTGFKTLFDLLLVRHKWQSPIF